MSKKKSKFKSKEELTKLGGGKEYTEPIREEHTEPIREEHTEPIREEQIESKDFVNYYVRVNARRLKYFSGPGTNYLFLGLVKLNQEFLVIEETIGLDAFKWGCVELLNSEVWLPLDYCTKL